MLTKKYTALHTAIASLRFYRKCFNCNFDVTIYLELDHRIPKSVGGKNENFILLCSRCNKIKGTQDAEKFFSDSQLAELYIRLKLEFTAEQISDEIFYAVELEKIQLKKSNHRNKVLTTSVRRVMETKVYKNNHQYKE